MRIPWTARTSRATLARVRLHPLQIDWIRDRLSEAERQGTSLVTISTAAMRSLIDELAESRLRLSVLEVQRSSSPDLSSSR